MLIKRKITLILCIRRVAIIFICVYLDVQVHRGGCRPGSNVHMEVDSHTRIPLFVYFLTQRPIGVPGCVVCSLNARLRSSCAYGRSLSYLFAFTWTYGCIGVATGQVLMCIWRSILTPEFHFLLIFFILPPNRRAWLRGESSLDGQNNYEFAWNNNVSLVEDYLY